MQDDEIFHLCAQNICVLNMYLLLFIFNIEMGPDNVGLCGVIYYIAPIVILVPLIDLILLVRNVRRR